MTEPLFLLLFVYSVFYFLKYIHTDKTKYLIILGSLGFLQVLARYDGWFVFIAEALLIAYYEYIYRKRSFDETTGKVLLFATPVVFGAALWFLWNWLIYGNPLFFLLSQYSAKAQQDLITLKSGLATKGNLGLSSLTFWYDMLANVGTYIGAAAVLGIISDLFNKKDITKKMLLLFILISPILFNILALYLGFSIIKLPIISSILKDFVSRPWFNVRYGIVALPLVAVYGGLYVNSFPKDKIAVVALILYLIFFQSFIFWKKEGVITLIDGTKGASAFLNEDTSRFLKDSVKENEKVLLSMSAFNPVAFKSGLDLNHFIHEGVSKQWNFALEKPEEYATWIVMKKNDSSDPVYRSLVEKENKGFLNSYSLAFTGQESLIYKKGEALQGFQTEAGLATGLMSFKGVLSQ